MDLPQSDVVGVIYALLPGFLAAWIFYGLTAHPRHSPFERVVQALIFTGMVQAAVLLIRGFLLLLGRVAAIGVWTNDAAFIWSIVVESMASKGMGVIYTRTANGNNLRNGIPPKDRQCLLDAYYVPHQQAVATAVGAALAAHGTCLLVDAHSFPSTPLPHEPDQSPNRCQVCIGTDDYHTPPRLVEWLKESFAQQGLTVAVNRPFSGTFVPSGFYQANRNVVSVMIEINRSVYMDETTGERLPGFARFQSQLRQVLTSLADNSSFAEGDL